MRRLALLLLLSGCWRLLEPVAWVYEEVHPPPTCGPEPADNRLYDCVSEDGGYGGGPGHWRCVGPAVPGALLCDGGTQT